MLFIVASLGIMFLAMFIGFFAYLAYDVIRDLQMEANEKKMKLQHEKDIDDLANSLRK